MMKEKALMQLIEKNPIDLLPEGMMERQKQVIVSSVVERLKSAGMKEKEIEQYKKKHLSDFQTQARFMVHSSYLIDALARQLDISVSSREVEIYCQKTGVGNAQIDQKYGRIKDFLIREKTLDHLIDTATEI